MPGPAIRIAVVDDDASICKALARLLRANDFTVDTHVSAREFLGSLARAIPDCLIADLRMPEMTGIELHRRVAHVARHVPTILITAYGDEATRKYARTAGIDACLEKPVQEPTLLAAIKAATNRSIQTAR